METILLHPTYFPSIAQMAAVTQANEVRFEIQDNYQKQTYRNRSHIAHSNGRLVLNVPIRHSKTGRHQRTREVIVENSFPWQEQHWKSLQIAYRSSPFFEYYEDDLAPLFHREVRLLLDHNMEIFRLLQNLLGLESSFSFTSEYEKEASETDLRYLVNAKKEPEYRLTTYTQVLEANHGFLSNLSVLDLLFNEGPNALEYLEQQQIEF